jgi:hypothetical protein
MKIFHRNRLISDLDITLAVAGLLISTLATLWLYLAIHKYIEVGITLIFSCLAYLLIRKYLLPEGASSLLHPPQNRTFYLTVNLLFFVLLLGSILAVILRQDTYSRPLTYFILTTLMAAVLAVEIFFLPEKKAYAGIILLKIGLVTVSLLWIPQVIFPGLTGVDVWWHQFFTNEILMFGHIPGGYNYSELPIMHLTIGLVSSITCLDYKFSSMFSVSFLQLIGLFFVFLLGKFLFNSKVGLLAVLLLGMGQEWIPWGISVVPTSLAATMVLILVYLIFMPKTKIFLIITSLIIVMMGVLILTHTITTLCMAILLYLFWIAFKVYGRIYGVNFFSPVNLLLAIICTVGMFSWWTYASGSIFTLADLIRWGFRVDVWNVTESHTQYMQSVQYSEYLMGLLGFLIFHAFSIIGAFYMIARKYGSQHSFALVIGGIMLVMIGFLSLPLGLTGFLPHRWWFYSYFIMTIPAALGVFLVCNSFKSNWSRAVAVMVLVTILSFFSITSPTANRDNQIYSKNSGSRAAFTASELATMDTLAGRSSSEVGVVHSNTNYYFQFAKGKHVRHIDDNLYYKNFENLENVVIPIDDQIINSYFDANGGGMKLDYDPRQVLDHEGFNRIMAGGTASYYYRQ